MTVPRQTETLPAPVPGDPQAAGVALRVTLVEATGVALQIGVALHVVVEVTEVALHAQEDDKTKTS